jgi:hypothetical protein
VVSRTQIDRLSSRIEALAVHAKGTFGVDTMVDDPREVLMRRLGVIAERMRATAEERGEPFPPPLSLAEREDIIQRFRSATQRATHGD